MQSMHILRSFFFSSLEIIVGSPHRSQGTEGSIRTSGGKSMFTEVTVKSASAGFCKRDSCNPGSAGQGILARANKKSPTSAFELMELLVKSYFRMTEHPTLLMGVKENE